MLPRNRLKPIWLLLEARMIHRSFSSRCKPVRTLPAEFRSENRALVSETLIERASPQSAPGAMLFARPVNLVISAIGLNGARFEEPLV
jgi:hypothetical protein